MPLSFQSLSPDVCASPQLSLEDIAEAAQAGFKSIINNRPDFEGGPEQPTSQQLQSTAQALGLQYVHLPVSPAVQTPEEIAKFSALLDQLPRPILAFCRTGARSGKLYRAATEG